MNWNENTTYEIRNMFCENINTYCSLNRAILRSNNKGGIACLWDTFKDDIRYTQNYDTFKSVI